MIQNSLDSSVDAATPDIVALQRTRAMFQRLSDARIFRGWIKEISPVRVVAHLRTPLAIEVDDEFSFQVYGSKMNASFFARVTARQAAEYGAVFATGEMHSPDSLELVCRVTTSMRYSSSVEEPRFCVEGATADIAIGPDRIVRSVAILDVGPRGFAAMTDQPFAKGEVAAVSLYTHGMLVRLDATVRNCVSIPHQADFKRVGFEITNLDRPNSARWKQVYAEVVASNQVGWVLDSAPQAGKRRSA